MRNLQSRYPTGWHILLLAGYVLLAAGYVSARFLWNWTSTDDARLTVAAEYLYAEGTIVPTETYPFGYAYPALNTFLSHLTGLSIRTLQVFVQPFLVVLLVPLAFAAYRNLMGDPAIGALAAMMLFLQPEFLFEAARSSHAKLTWAMALGLLYALAASFRDAEAGKPIGRWVVISYLFAFGLTTSSAFFASSYLFAIACAFVGWQVWQRWCRRQAHRGFPLTRLLYVVLSCSVLLLAMLLWLRPDLRPVVVTVHDIVPYLTRRQESMQAYRSVWERWLDTLATQALARADALIADSAYTRETIVQALRYPAERIRVVPLGVDHTLFRPRPVPPEFDARYGLDPGRRYVLYVGSENPRKNLPFLVRAFARLHQALPDVHLIRVGAVQYLPQARTLQEQIERAGLANAVLHYSSVPDEDLALFYNRADLFVFPSLYEGFGLPVLEAMACGTPVVCADAASLPEVAGDAALRVSPSDEEGWADAMGRALTDLRLREELRARGLEQARSFTWERTAEETVRVYTIMTT